MSTSAPARDASAPAPEPLARPLPPPRRRPRRDLARPALALPILFVLAAAYHAIQSTFHVTPAIFPDELLHAGLAQGFASGEPFTIRDASFPFPAPLPALLQSPAWLLGDAGDAYALAKVLNALVMSSAVFPVYWLARALVRRSSALVAAAAAVAAPAMLYHSYLLSEALAYPVFFLALGVLVRALANPSPRWSLAVLAVSGLAVGTRTQFVALPLAYLVGVAVVGRARWRTHAIAVVPLLLVGTLGLVVGARALGPYAGAAALEYPVGDVLRWASTTGLLVPLAAGLAIVPAAVLGLGFGLVAPRTRTDRPFAVLALAVGVLVLTQVGLVAAGDSARPLGRYAIYLAPLAFVFFFSYVERGAPRRRLLLVVGIAVAALGWLLPFPSLADNRFSFDSPELSAYGVLAVWWGHANAATIFGAATLVAGLAGVLAGRTRRAALAVAAASVALLAATGAVAYVGDHGMTKRAVASWAGVPADWLDKGGYGRADFLVLPDGPAYFGWTTESWNRDFGRPIWLGVERPEIDPFAGSHAEIARDGTLLVEGSPTPGGLLIVNDHGTRLDLEGTVLERPRAGLALVRMPEGARVRSMTTGLYWDGWSKGVLVHRAWPGPRRNAGVYVVRLSLPAGRPAREVVLAVDGGARRTVMLEPGGSAEVELPVAPGDGPAPALRATSARAELVDGRTANPRLVSFRVELLELRPAGRGSAGLSL